MKVREALGEDWGNHKPVHSYPISWQGDIHVNGEGIRLCVPFKQFTCGMEGQQSLPHLQSGTLCVF